jgi:signal peptidase I
LWVDGNVVVFDAPAAYDDLRNAQPDQSDRMPAGVASAGAALRVSHLRLLRDIYYIATRSSNGCLNDYDEPWFVSDDISDELIRNHPRQRFVDFPLSADRFFMLGDNSAGSFDGRLWGPVYWVDRDLLIGRAICVYWPHSWNAIRTPWVDIPFPWFPNFGRMRMTR